jgi:hypothetical protein
VQHSQGDVRSALTTVHDIFLCYGPRTITEEMFKGYVDDVSDKKRRNLGLFDAYRDMLSCVGDVGQIMSIYNTDKVLLPLTLHENYYQTIVSLKTTPTNKLRLMSQVSDRISKGDLVETDIYTDQSWQLQDMHCFISCVQPINMIISSAKQDVVLNTSKLSFSSELNKTSLKNINRKNFNNVCGIHPCFDDTEDVLDLSRLMCELIKSECTDMVQTVVNGLECSDTLRLIETVIKIDKCSEDIQLINTKWKKTVSPLVTIRTGLS